MPIKCKDYTWSETAEEVHISVPLKGVRAAKADIYSNDVYLKVNYPPYFFEADLLHAVDDVASSAMVGDGVVKFTLKKTDDAPSWGVLLYKGENPTAEERAELRARRDDAQQRSVERQKATKDAAETETRERQSAAVRKQMNLEGAERKRLADLKDAERKKMADIVDAAAAEQAEAEAEAEAARRAARKTARKARDPHSRQVAAAAVGPASKPALRPTRARGRIEVAFTPRAFATAARESHAGEEAEWLAKQQAARKAVSDAKRMCAEGGVDNDPLWLKDKGNAFMKAGDYKSARNAYTAAISLDSKAPALFSNRAAAHMKCDDYYAAAMDCSKALSLLCPPVEANAKSRLIGYSRRAAALAALGDNESALRDLQEAMALDPTNESLCRDRILISQRIQAAGQGQGEDDGDDDGDGEPEADDWKRPDGERDELEARLTAAGLTKPRPE